MQISWFETYKPPEHVEVMGAEEIRYWFDVARHDHWYLSQLEFDPLIMGWIGDNPANKRFLFNPAALSKELTRIVCSRIRKIEERKVLFYRTVTKKKEGKHPGKWVEKEQLHVVPVDVPQQPQPRRKFHHNHAWNPHVTCITCNKSQWLPVQINHVNYVACYNCLPPSQHATIGAVEQDFSLLTAWIENIINSNRRTYD